MPKINKEISTFKIKFDKLLTEYLQNKLQKCKSFEKICVPYFQHLTRIIQSDGKRLRPFLFYKIYKLYGGRFNKKALFFSLSLELLHVFALIHDDIMDNSNLRRHQPTIHKAIADETKKIFSISKAQDYGKTQAILLGDLTYAYSNEIFYTSAISFKNKSAKLHRIFTEMCEEVCFGQQLDIIISAFNNFDYNLQEKVMLFKSGYYSIARPMQLGAALAGAKDKDLHLLKKIGALLGIAFQIQDDILDLVGNKDFIGKIAGSDLIEKKITAPLLEAYYASNDNAKIITELFKKENLTQNDIHELFKIINTNTISKKIETKLLRKIKEISTLVDELSLLDTKKQFFQNLAEYLITRNK